MGKAYKFEPPEDLIPVTPSDTADLSEQAYGVLLSVDGDLVVITKRGTTRTYPAGTLALNVIHPLQILRVKATGTTATGIFVAV